MNQIFHITEAVPIDDFQKIKDGGLPMSFTEHATGRELYVLKIYF